MQIVSIDLKRPDKRTIKEAAGVILAGGVVAFPTDTAYGLATNALDEEAIGKLFLIKQRVQKPLPVIVSTRKMLDMVAEVSADEEKLIKKHWPGALTIIFRKKKTVPPFLTLGLPTIGVRIPDSKLAVMLIVSCGRPLTSTSANVTGKGNCYTRECVKKMFQDVDNQPDMLLDAGELPEVPVSTVVQIESGEVKILREGPISVSA